MQVIHAAISSQSHRPLKLKDTCRHHTLPVIESSHHAVFWQITTAHSSYKFNVHSSAFSKSAQWISERRKALQELKNIDDDVDFHQSEKLGLIN